MEKRRFPKVGDRIEVSNVSRFKGQTGKIIAIGDSPTAEINHYHIYFDGDVWGTIGGREIWLGLGDFYVYESVEDNNPPTGR